MSRGVAFRFLFGVFSMLGFLASDGKSEDRELPALCPNALIRVEEARERFGQLSQNDPRLREKGLFFRNRSNLCGPVCLVNAMEYLVPGLDPIEEVRFLVEDLGPSIGLQQLRRQMGDGEFERLAQVYFKERGVAARVRTRSLLSSVEPYRSIRKEDLLAAQDPQQLVFLVIQIWSQRWRERVRPEMGSSVFAPHFLLLSGVEESHSGLVVSFVDELEDTRLRSGQLRLFRSANFPADTWEIESEQLFESDLAVVLEAVIFRLAP